MLSIIYCLLSSFLNSQTSTPLLSDSDFASPGLLSCLSSLAVKLEEAKVIVRTGGVTSCVSADSFLSSRRFCLMITTDMIVMMIAATMHIASAVISSLILIILGMLYSLLAECQEMLLVVN